MTRLRVLSFVLGVFATGGIHGQVSYDRDQVRDRLEKPALAGLRGVAVFVETLPAEVEKQSVSRDTLVTDVLPLRLVRTSDPDRAGLRRHGDADGPLSPVPSREAQTV